MPDRPTRTTRMKVAAVQASPVFTMNRDATIDIAPRAYALESQCFVVLSAMYIPPSEGERAALGKASWTFFGGSAIMGPEGDLIAGPMYDEETILYGDVDFDRIVLRKASADVSEKDNRWDIMRVESNAQPYSPFSGSFGQQLSSDMRLTGHAQECVEKSTCAIDGRLDAIAEELRLLRE